MEAKKGQSFVQIKLGGQELRALLDTRASHNFLMVEEAKRLGIPYEKEMGWLKAVNSSRNSIHGVARDVKVRIGNWHGTLDFFVVPMDNYQETLEEVQTTRTSCGLSGGECHSTKVVSLRNPIFSVRLLTEGGSVGVIPCGVKGRCIVRRQFVRELIFEANAPIGRAEELSGGTGQNEVKSAYCTSK
ncbi:hypothetical protein GH714_031984 [Hevea brasiliensis]|uniref:Aspartic peptidase DDI1-type domain-containing protein n=1 Tax=Hevea brasiliensis TaxID=3981 RepID=A0A6A6LDE5_HEVBR|nr:hypothetical protein GH714_031984 [Hevea brasiliensis]